jgi:hypothetical protein
MEKQEVENTSMPDQMDFQVKARSYVYQYSKEHGQNLTFSDVRIVWFCKTLQNWKAMVAVLIPDGLFFEVTYNGDKQETYLDAYKKIENVRISD